MYLEILLFVFMIKLMNVGKKIALKRKEKKWTQGRLADQCGWEQARISHYETGRREPSLNDLNLIADKLDLRVEYLVSNEEAASNVEPAHAKRGKAPLISNIQAGTWMEGIDVFAPNDAEEWLPKPIGGENSYYLRIVGASMTAPVGQSFPEGNLVLIDPDAQWGNGSYIVAKIVGQNGVTFKQLKYDEQGLPYLHALNPKFDSTFDEFRVLGKMVFSGNFY